MIRNALLATFLLMTTAMHAATTVILVRHAEKAAMEGDMPISEAGTMRANELARVLADARISAIYTTQYRRTNDTVAPLAKALKLEPRKMQTGKTYASEIVRTIREKHAGETVLVADHSNTTVDVLRELGMEDPPFIPEPQFDDLFVCTLDGDEPASCVALRYGAVTR